MLKPPGMRLASTRDPQARAQALARWAAEQGWPSQQLRVQVTYRMGAKGAPLGAISGTLVDLAKSVTRTQSAWDLLLRIPGQGALLSVPAAQIITIQLVQLSDTR